MQTVNIEVYAGDDLRITLRVNKGGSPVDFAGADVSAQVRPYPASEDVVGFAVDTSAGEGTINLSMSADDTNRLTMFGAWDCRVHWPDGSTETVARGQVKTKSSVSRSSS